MKKLYLFLMGLTICCYGYSQNVNYTVEIVNFQQVGCNDGAGSDEEPTWKAWVTDNHTATSPGSTFPVGTEVGGTCYFDDSNIPIVYVPGGSLVVLNEVDVDATTLSFRFDAWEDDCDGGSGSDRCSFSNSCLFGTQEDDCRQQLTTGAYNFQDSTMCEWHTITNAQGDFLWVMRFKWEYTVADAGPLVQESCGDSIVMSAQGSGQWSVLSGGAGGFSSNLDPTATFGGVAGNSYTLQWSSMTGCMTSFSQDIQVDLNAEPVPNLATSATILCEFADVSFTAANGITYDWMVNSTGNIVHDDTTVGAYTLMNLATTDTVVYVEATDANGCMGLDSISLNVQPSPVVDLGADTTICDGATILLDANDSVLFTGYVWNTSATTSSISVTAPGQYIVELTHTNSCTNSDTINISYYAPINLALANADVMCLGDSVMADAGPGFTSYLWSDGDTIQTNTFYTFGTYNVTVTDTNNCTITDSIVVSPAFFSYSIGSDTTISLGAVIDLTANPGISYSWSTGDTTQTVSVSPTADQTFTATTELANGCFEVGTINVFVSEDLNIFIPNMFSPNGDGSNDEFLVYGFGISDIDFRIFNRWGKEVWSTTDITELQTTGWNGQSNGEDQPTGTYVWTMTGNTVTGVPVSFEGANQGTILLRR